MSKLANAPWGAIASIAAALAYDASPFGLVNDMIPILGWIDNAAVNGVLVGLAAYLMWKRRQKQSAIPVEVVDRPRA